MSYDIYYYGFFIGGAVLSAIMLAVTVLLFFVLKIPTVIGDLSGLTARKAIENIRTQNESTGHKTYQTSLVNKERGKLTDKISPSGRLIKNPTDTLGAGMATTKISTQQLSPEDMASSETTVLTSELNAGETTLLDDTSSCFSDETTILYEAPVTNVFAVEYEITFIHTNEVID